MKPKQFIDLPENKQKMLIKKAFDYLCQEGLVPYGVQTGDDCTWDTYDPAVELAAEWYEE